MNTLVNIQRMEYEKYYVYTAMQKYGGGFVSSLGYALMRADHRNTLRIKEAFPDYWERYLEIGETEWNKNNP